MTIQERVIDKYMKVHPTSRSEWKDHNCPEKVPYSLLSEEQAKRNHDQTLDRLNERGGMGVLELLDNIHKRRLSHGRESIQHLEELKRILVARLIPEAKEEKTKYCDCNFVMLMRDEATQKAYCAKCNKEVNEGAEEEKESHTWDSLMKEWGDDTDGSEPMEWILKNFILTRKT